MNRRAFSLLFCVLCSGLVSTAWGEEATDPADTSRIEAMQEALEAEEQAGRRNQPLFAPRAIPGELLDEDGQTAMKDAFRAYYDYRTQGFNHRQRVFEWQLLSSKIIFVVVIFLVGAGIFFSWLQFRADMKKTDAGGESSVSTLEASTTGLKVSSPVLGVIILVISLLFFYLYLQYVYPIEEIL